MPNFNRERWYFFFFSEIYLFVLSAICADNARDSDRYG